jgi:hypothetical protein
MVRESLVCLAVTLDNLLITTVVCAYNLLLALILVAKCAVNDKELLAMEHTLRIAHAQRRLAHGKVVYGINDICLASAVVADKAIYALLELDILLCKILEIYQ